MYSRYNFNYYNFYYNIICSIVSLKYYPYLCSYNSLRYDLEPILGMGIRLLVRVNILLEPQSCRCSECLSRKVKGEVF